MISNAISQSTAKHVAAFYRNAAGSLLLGEPKSSDQGTMTFVKYKRRCFGLTNWHVVETLENDGTVLPTIGLLKMGPVPGRKIFDTNQDNFDFPYDLAIYVLDEATVRHGGKPKQEYIKRINDGIRDAQLGDVSKYVRQFIPAA